MKTIQSNSRTALQIHGGVPIWLASHDTRRQRGIAVLSRRIVNTGPSADPYLDRLRSSAGVILAEYALNDDRWAYVVELPRAAAIRDEGLFIDGGLPPDMVMHFQASINYLPPEDVIGSPIDIGYAVLVAFGDERSNDFVELNTLLARDYYLDRRQLNRDPVPPAHVGIWVIEGHRLAIDLLRTRYLAKDQDLLPNYIRVFEETSTPYGSLAQRGLDRESIVVEFDRSSVSLLDPFIEAMSQPWLSGISIRAMICVPQPGEPAPRAEAQFWSLGNRSIHELGATVAGLVRGLFIRAKVVRISADGTRTLLTDTE